MRIVRFIARWLLGLLFLVFGLNGFWEFIKMPPPQGITAPAFLWLMFSTHYLHVVFALQIAGGAILLTGRFVPLALTLLGPVVVNIVIYHACIDPQGVPTALVILLLWLIVFSGVWRAFTGIFQARV